MQDGRDGDREIGYIANVTDGTVIGFKYLDFRSVGALTVRTRGYIGGKFTVRTSPDGEVLGEVPVGGSNIWQAHTAPVAVPDGVRAVYLCFSGGGSGHLKSIEFS